MALVFSGFWEQQMPSGRRVMHRPGDAVTVDGPDLERLRRLGVVTEEAPAPVSTPIAEEPEDAPEPESPPVEKRPARAASLDQWRQFAESKGVPTRGLSKQEIIAATR